MISRRKTISILFALFFETKKIDFQKINNLLNEAITNQNEEDFDLLLSLIENFEITKSFDLVIAKQLIEPWHHFHERLAVILEIDKNVETVDFLIKGCTFCCENLDYQSDYKGFNRKCMFALKKINTTKAINYLRTLQNSSDSIISKYASDILEKN